MGTMTITEALAERTLIQNKLATKQNFVLNYLVRSDTLKDPLEKDGGSAKIIAQERQAMADLTTRLINIYTKIHQSNAQTMLTIEGMTQTIDEWLVWRSSVAPLIQTFQSQMNQKIQSSRHSNSRQTNQTGSEATYTVNIDERSFNEEIQITQQYLDRLNGALSLSNAVNVIDI